MLYPSPSPLLLCLLVASISPILCQQYMCPGTPQALISGDVYRVEDDQLSASSIYSSSFDPPNARVRVSGADSWCSTTSDTEPWFQVDFNRDVVIHTLEMGGYSFTSFTSSFYISEFTIEHGSNSSELSSILLPNSNDPMIFTRPATDDLTFTPLPTPLTTRVLRIVTVSRVGTESCLYLEAFGCPLTTAITDAPVSTTMMSTTDDSMSTTMMSTTDAAPPSSSPATTAPPQTDVMTTTLASAGNVAGASTGVVVGGAVGGVIVLVLLVLLMVVLLGCLLVKHRSGKARLVESEVTYSTAEGGVRVVDNDIYGDETPPPSPEPHYEKQMEGNIQYESLKTPPTNAIDIANTYDTIGSPKVNASSTPYESVGSPLVYTYAKVDTPIKVVLPGNRQAEGFSENIQVSPIIANTAYGSSLTDNVAYGSSLTDNEAYVGMKSESETENGKRVVDNPLYGSTDVI